MRASVEDTAIEYHRETHGQNFYRLDVNLQRLLRRSAGPLLDAEDGRLAAFGAWVGGEVDAEAEHTSRFAPPVLETYDRDGETANRVRYNPLYEAVHRDVYRHGIVGLNYGAEPKPFLLTFAMGYLLAQADISIHCPVTLTGAVAYVLDRFAPAAVKDAYIGQLLRMDGAAKSGGTWATERDCGSDLAATTTVARPSSTGFSLTGLKWFTSNADGGLALVTARPEGAPEGGKGLGLYLLPLALDDGSPNRYRIRRLKDKLGTRGLATGEIDLLGAYATEVAPPPEGLKVMMEALGFSRIHNAVAAAGVQRRAFLEAAGHASHRRAFGDVLAAYPMVQDTLLDMLMNLEAGVALAFEAARAFDRGQQDEAARPWQRTATALAKYQTSEQAVIAASQAIEMLGGNGYTEEFVTARLLRDGQVLSVWEGPANIQALELLRLVAGRHDGFGAFAARIEAVLGACEGPVGDIARPVKDALGACSAAVALIREAPEKGPYHGRRLLAIMADTLAAALLLEEAAADHAGGDARKTLIARGFIATRLTPSRPLGVEERDIWPKRHFRALVGYESIEPREISV